MVRTLLGILGVLLVLMGGLWTLQGLGIVMWPAESFMLDQRRWAFYGIVAVAAGALLVRFSRRSR